MPGKITLLLVCLLLLLAGIDTTSALAQGPVWSITSMDSPEVFQPGDSSGYYQVNISAVNEGEAATDGAPITVSDLLPAGLTATYVKGEVDAGEFFRNYAASCTVSPVSCTYAGKVLPYEALTIHITVDVSPSTRSGGINSATVAGGGAATASVSRPIDVGTTPAGFGIDQFEMAATNEDGSIDTQAGSHPYQLTTTFGLNTAIGQFNLVVGLEDSNLQAVPAALAKDLQFELPPGLIGNPTVFSQCSDTQFTTFFGSGADACPAETAIGVAEVLITSAGKLQSVVVPLFNLKPNVGEPARFGFEVDSTPVYLDTAVRTGGNYGVVVDVTNISQAVGFVRSRVVFWGVPGSPSHDASRGWNCLAGGDGEGSCAQQVDAQSPPPFITMPTSCTGPLKSAVDADSWQDPGDFVSADSTTHDSEGNLVGLDGCNKLDFKPTISAAADGQAANTPTGLSVDIHVPQAEGLVATGLAESEVKNTTVTLPQGVALSPGAADGLQACTSDEIALDDPDEPSCPDAAKVATVTIKTPLLPDPLKGEAYLGAQDENPFGSLVALYIVAKDPVSGVLVKLAGQVVPDPVTGQLVSTFADTPQLPFEDLELDFFGTARAPLTTPPTCGTYTTEASIDPWSGNPAATPSSQFEITSGPNGTPCADPQPFNPAFTAGMTNNQAGAFSPFTLTMTRPDQDQTLSGVQVRMPPGLLGTLSTVKLCGEPQAAQGTCGAESLIGETTVSAGLGGDPYTVTGGKVYITGPYKGAPFGLSIVNPAVAGPFNLGSVVVRAAISVDPTTAQLTITTDPLPTIIDGIPLQLQHVNVTIDRPSFTFDPTNCNHLSIDATLSSSSGQSAAGSSPFQATNCASLAFDPHLQVSTSGRTSRANGASLLVKLTYPTGPYDANIASVKVELPKALPSRLSTLQRACAAATFQANPAACPAASQIGYAKAITPVLPVPLMGPAYFVSHGGEAFPSLIVVLQGYGVRVDLVGSTFISKQGITSSTFKTVPDVPVGTFQLYLPQGPFSALTANRNLCKGAALAMPTTFLAQNGAEIDQSNKITVIGCPKAKKAKKAAKASRVRKARTAGHLHTAPRRGNR